MIELLTNKWIAGPLIALFLCAGMWIAGDVHGHKAQSAKDTKAVAAATARADTAESANATNLATIQSLREANQRYADAASLAQAQEQRAEAELRQQVQANAKALADAQRRLQETIHAHPDTARWAATRVPADILRQLTGADADSHHP